MKKRGDLAHLGTEKFLQLAGFKATTVPYQGEVLALNALLAGDLTGVFISPALSGPQLQAGTVRALAATSRRSAALLKVTMPENEM